MYIQTIFLFSSAYLAIHVLDTIALSYDLVAILYPAANAAIEEIMITAENVRTHRLIFISSWAQQNVCSWAEAANLLHRYDDPETVIRAIFVASQLQTFIHVRSGSRASSISASWPS